MLFGSLKFNRFVQRNCEVTRTRPILAGGDIQEWPHVSEHQDPQTGQLALVTARRSVEEEISEIWRDVLDINQVGPHDNFFEIGGHSFLAIQIILRLKDRYGIELPFLDFLDSPTVHAQSKAIDDMRLRSL
jgi:acyl carrier protein